MELDVTMSARLPSTDPGEEEWMYSNDGEDITAQLWLGERFFDIIFSESDSPGTTLEEAAATALLSAEQYAEADPERWDFPVERTDNRVVDGVEGYVMQSLGPRSSYYRWGTVHKGCTFSIAFEFPSSYAAGRPQIEQVLASIDWK